MRDQCALGVAGGATGVDQHRWVVGPRFDRFERRALMDLGRGPFRIHLQHVLQTRAQGLRRLNNSQSRGMAQRHFRITVLEAKNQRFGAKEHGQGHGHCAHLQDCDIGHCRLKTLRHHNRDPVPLSDPFCLQHMGQSVRLCLQLGIGVGLAFTIGAIGSDRHLVFPLGVSGPSRTADLGHIEIGGHIPAKLRL